MQQQSCEVLALLKNFKVGKLIINKQIGQGEQGFVYLAKCAHWGIKSNKEVALKFQESIYVTQKEIEFLNVLKSYQNSQNEIDHPSNLIQVLDTFYHNQKQKQGQKRGEIFRLGNGKR